MKNKVGKLLSASMISNMGFLCQRFFMVNEGSVVVISNNAYINESLTELIDY